MLAMPSMWSMTVTILVFFVAAWYIYRYLDEQGIQKGMTRGIVVLTFATLLSWGSGEVSTWVEHKISGPKPVAQVTLPPSDDASPTGKSTPQE